jgi:hypothetical protein
LQNYDTIEDARLAALKADSDAIINHFTTYGVVPALGLIAPNGNVTGAAKIQ